MEDLKAKSESLDLFWKGIRNYLGILTKELL